MKILILGGTGMLGHVLFKQLSKKAGLEVQATVRSYDNLNSWFSHDEIKRIRSNVDANDFDAVVRALAAVKPDVVINCIGLIKQLPKGSDPLSAITVNAQLPHRLSLVCRSSDARLIHISTDCVFDGEKGMYKEDDITNAIDLYGRTKSLGEVSYSPHCITLRTSIVGHELKGGFGLIEWFLAQEEKVRGYKKAIYSGFPTVELARIISKYVLPNSELTGIYHVSADPISKYDLLNLVAKRYKKDIKIEPDEDFVLDRSLDSSRFRSITGYSPPSWVELVNRMYIDYEEHKENYYGFSR